MKTRIKYLVSTAVLVMLTALPPEGMSQNTFWGYSFGVSSSKWRGDADRFASELSQSVNSELEAEGFDVYSGVDFRNKSRVGICLNIYLEQRLYKGLFIHPELSYTAQGSRFVTKGDFSFRYDWQNYSVDMKEVLTYKYNYLQLPVLVSYRFGENAKWKARPFVQAGPHVGVLISSKNKIYISMDGESDSDTQKDPYSHKIDCGLTTGFGVDLFTNKTSAVRFEFRYQTGFVPVIKEEYDDGFKMMNRFYSVNLGVILD